MARALKIESEWNLVKLFKTEHKISLLNYPTFYEDSYPALYSSNLVDLGSFTVKQMSYTDSENPPILHRKELMVTSQDPMFEHFCSLTKEGEEAGLYENPFKIGFKQGWERVISEAGFELIDGHIRKSSSQPKQ